MYMGIRILSAKEKERNGLKLFVQKSAFTLKPILDTFLVGEQVFVLRVGPKE